MPPKIQSYTVAGHVFSLEMDAGSALWGLLRNYVPFRVETAAPAAFSIKVGPSPNPATENIGPETAQTGEQPPNREQRPSREQQPSREQPLYREQPPNREQQLYRDDPAPGAPRIDIFKTAGGGYRFELTPSGRDPVAGMLLTAGGFSEGHLLIEDPACSEFCLNNALMLQYAFRTATEATLEMHASVTVCDGKGYLFLGTSGTGKSTHSALWLRHIPGTHLLNDDNPVVRVRDGIARVYGTPWSGKTPCYRNEDYPVGAVVQIRQAPRNAIRRLTVPEAVAVLSASCSGLKSIRSVGDGLFATIAAVVGGVPCYLLDCLPDREAAELCHRTVTEDGK